MDAAVQKPVANEQERHGRRLAEVGEGSRGERE